MNDPIGFDATLPTGRDLSQAHDRVEFRVRESSQERLDRYLLQRLGWKSRNKIQRLIRAGRVTINGETPKIARKIARGDVIRIALDGGGGEVDPGASPLDPPIWEDPYLVAVHKPPHRLVHPVGRTVSGTIINELHHRYRGSHTSGLRPVVPKLCHRLDRETSGLLLVAKCDLARRRLSDDFEHGRVRKTYLAVVEGETPNHFDVDVPILAHLDREREQNNRLARAHPDGKWAETGFERLATDGTLSLVRCFPRTGRQNQIRVHLAHAGHAIVGDVGYGSTFETFPEAERRALLHSESLEFSHPIWRLPRTLRAPQPTDFEPFLTAMTPTSLR